MKPDKWLQPHCAVEMGSLFPLTTSSGGPRADHGRKQVAGGEMETGDSLRAAHCGSHWTLTHPVAGYGYNRWGNGPGADELRCPVVVLQ